MAKAEEYDPCLNQSTAHQSMSDPTPNSPQDLFEQADRLALQIARTQVHLDQANEIDEKWQKVEDDEIVKVDGKYIKYMSSTLKFYIEVSTSCLEIIRNQRNFLDKYFEA